MPHTIDWYLWCGGGTPRGFTAFAGPGTASLSRASYSSNAFKNFLPLRKKKSTHTVFKKKKMFFFLFFSFT